MIINDLEIANAQARAECTRNEILQAFPHDLLARENQLATIFKARRGNPLVNLESLYAFMNEVYQIVNKFTPCKKDAIIAVFTKSPYLSWRSSLSKSISLSDP